MATGRVKFYHFERGYGFISDDAAPTADGIFFHVSNVRDGSDEGVESVVTGARVSFSVESSRRRAGMFSAYNVKLLEE